MSVRYEWQDTHNGRRYRRIVDTGKPAKVEKVEPLATPFDDATEVDYSAMSKAELVSAAEAAGVDTVGTKATLIERLTNG